MAYKSITPILVALECCLARLLPFEPQNDFRVLSELLAGCVRRFLLLLASWLAGSDYSELDRGILNERKLDHGCKLAGECRTNTGGYACLRSQRREANQ